MKEITASNKYRNGLTGKYIFREQKYTPIFNQFYEECYANVFGRTIRTEAGWEFIFDTMAHNHYKAFGIFDHNNLVGYVVADKNVIVELALVTSFILIFVHCILLWM